MAETFSFKFRFIVPQLKPTISPIEYVKLTIGILLFFVFVTHVVFTGIWNGFIHGPIVIISFSFLAWTTLVIYWRKTKQVVLETGQMFLLWWLTTFVLFEIIVQHGIVSFLNLMAIGCEFILVVATFWGLICGSKYLYFFFFPKPLPPDEDSKA